MAITTKLELRQSQSLVMTPQLQQAIKLLQLSNMELAAFVETELERNPLLERAEGEEGAPVNGETSEAALNLFKDESGDGEGASPAPDVDASEGDGDWLDLQADDKVRADELDTEPQDAFADADGFTPGALKDSGWSGLAGGQRLEDGGAPDLEAYVAEERTLKDHLADQLALAFSDPARRLIGQHLIDMTDEGGYLRGDLDALAELLGAPRELVEETLRRDAGLRAVRRVRPRLARMPGAAAEGARSLRSDHGRPDRASRSSRRP